MEDETNKQECLGCQREKGLLTHGHIIKTEYFDAHQDFLVPIPGFVIVSSRRHIDSIEEFSEEEQKDFIKLVCLLRKAQGKILNIKNVYLINEEGGPHHFHLWMFPRHEWMEEKFGLKIHSVIPIIRYAKENMRTEQNEKEIQEVTEKLKQFLSKETKIS